MQVNRRTPASVPQQTPKIANKEAVPNKELVASASPAQLPNFRGSEDFYDIMLETGFASDNGFKERFVYFSLAPINEQISTEMEGFRHREFKVEGREFSFGITTSIEKVFSRIHCFLRKKPRWSGSALRYLLHRLNYLESCMLCFIEFNQVICKQHKLTIEKIINPKLRKELSVRRLPFPSDFDFKLPLTEAEGIFNELNFALVGHLYESATDWTMCKVAIEALKEKARQLKRDPGLLEPDDPKTRQQVIREYSFHKRKLTTSQTLAYNTQTFGELQGQQPFVVELLGICKVARKAYSAHRSLTCDNIAEKGKYPTPKGKLKMGWDAIFTELAQVHIPALPIKGKKPLYDHTDLLKLYDDYSLGICVQEAAEELYYNNWQTAEDKQVEFIVNAQKYAKDRFSFEHRVAWSICAVSSNLFQMKWGQKAEGHCRDFLNLRADVKQADSKNVLAILGSHILAHDGGLCDVQAIIDVAAFLHSNCNPDFSKLAVQGCYIKKKQNKRTTALMQVPIGESLRFVQVAANPTESIKHLLELAEKQPARFKALAKAYELLLPQEAFVKPSKLLGCAPLLGIESVVWLQMIHQLIQLDSPFAIHMGLSLFCGLQAMHTDSFSLEKILEVFPSVFFMIRSINGRKLLLNNLSPLIAEKLRRFLEGKLSLKDSFQEFVEGYCLALTSMPQEQTGLVFSGIWPAQASSQNTSKFVEALLKNSHFTTVVTLSQRSSYVENQAVWLLQALETAVKLPAVPRKAALQYLIPILEKLNITYSTAASTAALKVLQEEGYENFSNALLIKGIAAGGFTYPLASEAVKSVFAKKKYAFVLELIACMCKRNLAKQDEIKTIIESLEALRKTFSNEELQAEYANAETALLQLHTLPRIPNQYLTLCPKALSHLLSSNIPAACKELLLMMTKPRNAAERTVLQGLWLAVCKEWLAAKELEKAYALWNSGISLFKRSQADYQEFLKELLQLGHETLSFDKIDALKKNITTSLDPEQEKKLQEQTLLHCQELLNAKKHNQLAAELKTTLGSHLTKEQASEVRSKLASAFISEGACEEAQELLLQTANWDQLAPHLEALQKSSKAPVEKWSLAAQVLNSAIKDKPELKGWFSSFFEPLLATPDVAAKFLASGHFTESEIFEFKLKIAQQYCDLGRLPEAQKCLIALTAAAIPLDKEPQMKKLANDLFQKCCEKLDATSQSSSGLAILAGTPKVIELLDGLAPQTIMLCLQSIAANLCAANATAAYAVTETLLKASLNCNGKLQADWGAIVQALINILQTNTAQQNKQAALFANSVFCLLPQIFNNLSRDRTRQLQLLSILHFHIGKLTLTPELRTYCLKLIPEEQAITTGEETCAFEADIILLEGCFSDFPELAAARLALLKAAVKTHAEERLILSNLEILLKSSLAEAENNQIADTLKAFVAQSPARAEDAAKLLVKYSNLSLDTVRKNQLAAQLVPHLENNVLLQNQIFLTLPELTEKCRLLFDDYLNKQLQNLEAPLRLEQLFLVMKQLLHCQDFRWKFILEIVSRKQDHPLRQELLPVIDQMFQIYFSKKTNLPSSWQLALVCLINTESPLQSNSAKLLLQIIEDEQLYHALFGFAITGTDGLFFLLNLLKKLVSAITIENEPAKRKLHLEKLIFALNTLRPFVCTQQSKELHHLIEEKLTANLLTSGLYEFWEKGVHTLFTLQLTSVTELGVQLISNVQLAIQALPAFQNLEAKKLGIKLLEFARSLAIDENTNIRLDLQAVIGGLSYLAAQDAALEIIELRTAYSRLLGILLGNRVVNKAPLTDELKQQLEPALSPLQAYFAINARNNAALFKQLKAICTLNFNTAGLQELAVEIAQEKLKTMDKSYFATVKDAFNQFTEYQVIYHPFFEVGRNKPEAWSKLVSETISHLSWMLKDGYINVELLLNCLQNLLSIAATEEFRTQSNEVTMSVIVPLVRLIDQAPNQFVKPEDANLLYHIINHLVANNRPSPLLINFIQKELNTSSHLANNIQQKLLNELRKQAKQKMQHHAKHT